MNKNPKILVKAIASFFFLGYSPLAPGTVGSIGGILIYFLIRGNNLLYFFSTIAVLIAGLFVCGKAEGVFGEKDPKQVVIDEVFGMLIALYAAGYSAIDIMLGFFLFRLFDIWKPPPIRAVHGLRGSLGVMGDDLLAGLYTIFSLQLINRVFPT